MAKPFWSFLIALVILVSFASVSAQNNSGNSSEGAATVPRDDFVPHGEKVVEATTSYTVSFYIAIGSVVFLALIGILFFYLFFRRPKNSWEHLNEAKEKLKRDSENRVLAKPPVQNVPPSGTQSPPRNPARPIPRRPNVRRPAARRPGPRGNLGPRPTRRMP